MLSVARIQRTYSGNEFQGNRVGLLSVFYGDADQYGRKGAHRATEPHVGLWDRYAPRTCLDQAELAFQGSSFLMNPMMAALHVSWVTPGRAFLHRLGFHRPVPSAAHAGDQKELLGSTLLLLGRHRRLIISCVKSKSPLLDLSALQYRKQQKAQSLKTITHAWSTRPVLGSLEPRVPQPSEVHARIFKLLISSFSEIHRFFVQKVDGLSVRVFGSSLGERRSRTTERKPSQSTLLSL